MGILGDLEDAARNLQAGRLDEAERDALDASDTLDRNAAGATVEAVDVSSDALGYASNVRLGTALFNAFTPGGPTENPYGADNMLGQEEFGIDDHVDNTGPEDTPGDGGGVDPTGGILSWVFQNPGKVIAVVVFLYLAPLLASSVEVVANLTED